MEIINQILLSIKDNELKKEEIEKNIENERKLLLEELNKNNLKQYKDDIATVSFVERKTLKFIAPKEDILKKLEDENLVKYIEVIPEQIIPETKQINKKFEEDLKAGEYSLEGVEVETKESPMIRFNK